MLNLWNTIKLLQYIVVQYEERIFSKNIMMRKVTLQALEARCYSKQTEWSVYALYEKALLNNLTINTYFFHGGAISQNRVPHFSLELYKGIYANELNDTSTISAIGHAVLLLCLLCARVWGGVRSCSANNNGLITLNTNLQYNN